MLEVRFYLVRWVVEERSYVERVWTGHLAFQLGPQSLDVRQVHYWDKRRDFRRDLLVARNLCKSIYACWTFLEGFWFRTRGLRKRDLTTLRLGLELVELQASSSQALQELYQHVHCWDILS